MRSKKYSLVKKNSIKRNSIKRKSIKRKSTYRRKLSKNKSRTSLYKGWTLDTYIGFGIGYRLTKSNWESNSDYDKLFSNVPDSPISIPLRLGITIGYIF